jgi:hypothetical protein
MSDFGFFFFWAAPIILNICPSVAAVRYVHNSSIAQFFDMSSFARGGNSSFKTNSVFKLPLG